MEKLVYLTHPIRCITTGPSECGKSYFLTKLFINIINEFEKIYIYSSNLRQILYQKLAICLNNYKAIRIISYFFNEKDVDVLIDEIVKDNEF